MSNATTAFSRRTLMAGAMGLGAALSAKAEAQVPAPQSPESPDVTRIGPSAPWTDEGFVRVGGGRMHWAAIGAGPAVVMLPKLSGWIADWRGVATILAGTHRIILIDPPGHGGSVMTGPPPFLQTQEESAGMVMKALDTLGVDRFAMVGNSMGGSISLVTAVMWPDRVSRLAMVTTALPGATPLAQIVASADAKDQVWDGDVTYERIYRLFGSSREIYDQLLLSQKAAGAWMDPSERGVRSAGLIDYLSRVKAPTMLIYGDRSGPGYKRYLPEIVRRRPDIPIVHIQNAGAFAHQDNPLGTAEVLSRFLAST